MELIDFLINSGSKDLEQDMKILRKLKSEQTRMRISRYIRNLVGQKILVVLSYSGGTAARYEKGIVSIILNVTMAYEPESNYEKMLLKLQGLAAHEAGHLLYTDFEAYGRIQTQAMEAQQKVPLIAATIDKSNPVFNQELYDTIYKYIYSTKMVTMANSLEDGAIENAMGRDFPFTYGALVSMRDFMYNLEAEGLKHASFTATTVEDIDILITEIRMLCVIAYRKEVSIPHLESFIKKEDLEMIKWYTLYARLGAKDTLERIAMAAACLDYLKPIFKMKAQEYYEKYMQSLTMSPEDLLSSMNNMSPDKSELAIQGNLDPSLASMLPPTPPPASDFTLDLPEEVEKKINDKIKEQKEASENKNSGQSKGSSEQSEGGNGQNKGSDTEGTNEKNSAETSQESQDNAESNGQSEGSDETGQESQENAEEGAGNLNDNDDGESMTDSNGNKPVERQSALNQTDVAAAAAEAAAAVNQSISKLNSELQKEINGELQKLIKGKSNGKAPKNTKKLESPSVLSDLHHNVKTAYYPPEAMNGISREGSCVKKEESQLNALANNFARPLKQILMYMSKNRIKTGQRKGKIHQSGLYRAKTDARVFANKTQGKETKARLCVLIDQSGSMSGKKMVDAIKGAYLLASACQKIKVPISVYGHNFSSECKLYHYIDFEHSFDKSYLKKLYTADSGGCNRDGLAIFHACCDLVKNRKRNEKLVFLVLSDGAPSANNYYGEEAEADIQAIVEKFEKEYQVETIGIGIGYDTEHVPAIYKNYVLVPDVEVLPDELLKILKDIMTKS